MKESSPVAMQKKPDKLTIAIYGIIAVLVIMAFAMVGTAMDICTSKDGSIDTQKFASALSEVTNNGSLVIKSIFSGGYSLKMAFLGAFVIFIFILYKYSTDNKRLHRKGTEYGSAKWGDDAEIKSLADPNKKPEFKPILKDGKRVFDENNNFVGVTVDNNIILSKELKLSLNTYLHNLNLNVFIIGDSGSGKTRSFALPNIMQLNTSYIVTDPKGEILEKTGKMLEMAGYRVRVFNTINMENSNNYNPFHYVYTAEGKFSEQNVIKMVEVLFESTKGDGEKEDFWSQKGKSLLEAIIFLLFEESIYNAEFDENGDVIESTRDTTNLNFYSVAEKLRRLHYPPKGGEQVDGFFIERLETDSDEEYEAKRSSGFLCPLDKDFMELEKRKGDCLALRLYKEVRNAPEETGQSFLSSANVKTFIYNIQEVMDLSCCDNIHLETVGDEKTALFIIVPVTDKSFNFLVSIMYTQLFDTLINRANFKYESNGKKLPVHVRCIMDEFCNISQIPNFESILAYVRSMNMSVDIIVQTLSLFKSKYEKTWEGILGCCSSLLFIGGTEKTTKEYLSESLGKETIDIKGYNQTKGKQSSTSENNQIVGRELLTADEVGKIPKDKCLILMRSHNPFYNTKYVANEHVNAQFLSDDEKKDGYDVSTVHTIKRCDIKVNVNEPKVKLEKKFVVDLTDNVLCSSPEMSMLENALKQLSDISEEYKNDTFAKFGELSNELEPLNLSTEKKEDYYVDKEDTNANKSSKPLKMFGDIEDDPQQLDLDNKELQAEPNVVSTLFSKYLDINFENLYV